MSAENEGLDVDLPEATPDALTFTWDDAPGVLNVIAEEGGEVVEVDAWKHEERSYSSLGIRATFPHLHPGE